MPIPIAEYNATGGKCPACSSEDIVGECVTIAGPVAHQDCYCGECSATWTDFYNLSGYANLKGE